MTAKRNIIFSALLITLFVAEAPVAAKTTEILAFGDSITAGFGLPAGEALPARLETKLRADGLAVHVINAGNSGDTTADGLARLDWALAQKPDIVILELGVNDALRGLDPANDPATGRMLGNFPQAYSHIGLINSALNLSGQTRPAEKRAAG
jgi:acyl-CoA thioesterase I